MMTRLARAKRPNGGDIIDDEFFAPPARWQVQSDAWPSSFPAVAAAANAPAAIAAAGSSSQAPTAAPLGATAEDAERAWRHARRAGGVGSIGGSVTSPSSSSPGAAGTSSDGPLQSPVDLYDALVHSVRETQYTLQPPGVRF